MRNGISAGLCAVAAGVAGLAPVARADVYEVEMALFSFIYNDQENMDIDLTIQPGDTVRWIWISGMHNVVSGMDGDKDAGSEFFSGPPEFAAVFEHTFDTPGVYPYFCEVHVDFGMQSFVTVEEAGCAADVNGDGVLNILDFVEFQNLFVQMDPGGDCDGNGQFNILDFVCYQGLFQQGCP